MRQIDLHSLWDTLLISKSLRTIPSNYSHPLPSPQIEHALRGTIYDSYVRRVMWEGILGKWKDDVPQWLSCPLSPSPSHSSEMGTWQKVMTIWNQFGSPGGASDWDDEVVCPYAWAKPLHQLNCDIVWPKELDEPPYNSVKPSFSLHKHSDSMHSHSPEEELSLFSKDGTFLGEDSEAVRGTYLELDTPQYAGVIHKRWIIEKLMAKAGIRLAGVLNWLFADLDEGEGLSVLPTFEIPCN
jgi:hypothetical protein